jgi:hypothetical protein
MPRGSGSIGCVPVFRRDPFDVGAFVGVRLAGEEAITAIETTSKVSRPL